MGSHNFWHSFAHGLVLMAHSRDGLMAGRMLLTLFLCGVVGLERSAHERASGFRTHVLVGLGACLMTLAGGYGFHDLAGSATHGGDPMRVASYVVSGIGFLGAGAILRHGTSIRGMTTAASLWSAAGIGITAGAGLPALAAMAAGLILFTLVPLKNWEARLRLGQEAGRLAIHLRDDREAVGKTLVNLARMGITIRGATVLLGAGEAALLRVELAHPLNTEEASRLVRRLVAFKYVSRVDTRSLDLETDVEAPAEDAEDLLEEAVGINDSDRFEQEMPPQRAKKQRGKSRRQKPPNKAARGPSQASGPSQAPDPLEDADTEQTSPL